MERVIVGPERRTRVLSPEDRRLIAHHEAGHAVVSAAVPGSDVVHKVSIISRGHAGGMTWVSPGEEFAFASRSQLEDRMTVLLAGRAGEELLTGEPSSGAQKDIEVATQLARRMVAELGMGREVGPLSLAGTLGDGHVHIDAGRSERIASQVDAEVQSLLVAALERARALLEGYRTVWDALASRLIEEETLEGPDLELVLEAAARGPAPTSGSEARRE